MKTPAAGHSWYRAERSISGQELAQQKGTGVLYFAYGSNMDWQQMQERCPGSSFCGIATVDGHELCFPRLSNGRGCGVASIAPNVGGCVWGVVYEVSAYALAALDRYEGYREDHDASRNRYNRIMIEVFRDGLVAQPLSAWTYIAVPEPNPPLPSAAYVAHLVAGAIKWQLPAAYLAKLQAIELGEVG